MGLNDSAWERLFEEYRILENVNKQGEFVISANQIKKVREPRLMTKFDHRVNLPKIFSENRLSVLPVTRGDYSISIYSAYRDFEAPAEKVQKISIPAHLQSLMPQFLVSEAIALNCANACGILSDFLEDEHILPTVSGRMGSGAFDFQIDAAGGRRSLSVSNSQIEIDAAYEGIRFLSLFEAKRDIADDFLVRQLYYPFRAWHRRITKPVKSVFLIFSNGTFYLYEYRFEEPTYYNSLRLVKQKNYAVSASISLSDIENLIRATPLEPEPAISFPQANSMARIVNLTELLAEKPMTRQEITGKYAFDERQTNYYTDAGRYLKLIEKTRDEEGNILFCLSDFGKNLMQRSFRERQLFIVTQILKHKAFRETLKLRLQSGRMPDTKTVVRLMKQSNLYNVESDSTYERRSSTVTGWINWILSVADD